MFRPLAFVCASALMVSVALPASAQRESRTVQYGELNLYSDAGANTALRRIENASEQVCAAEPNVMTLRDRAMADACVDETMDYAVSDIGNSGLTSHYYGVEPQVIIEEDGDVYYGDKGK